jgi:hypothetical protein
MSTFTARTFTQVFDDSRAVGLLNDAAKDRYADSVLLPHGAYAHLEIQEEFAATGIPFVETVSDDFVYTALQETIPVPGAITDFAEPLELWEKGTNDSLWVPMLRASHLMPPLDTNLDSLAFWEWENGAIRVLPCSENRSVFVRYRRQLAYPAAGTTVGFDRIYLALVAGTAFFAATAREDVQKKAGAMYATAIQRAIRIASRDRQALTYRRQPWSGSGRRSTIRIE